MPGNHIWTSSNSSGKKFNYAESITGRSTQYTRFDIIETVVYVDLMSERYTPGLILTHNQYLKYQQLYTASYKDYRTYQYWYFDNYHYRCNNSLPMTLGVIYISPPRKAAARHEYIIIVNINHINHAESPVQISRVHRWMYFAREYQGSRWACTRTFQWCWLRPHSFGVLFRTTEYTVMCYDCRPSYRCNCCTSDE